MALHDVSLRRLLLYSQVARSLREAISLVRRKWQGSQEQKGEKRRPFDQFVHIYKLMGGMSALSNPAQAVQGGGKLAGDIAVRASAYHGFLELQPDLAAKSTGRSPERSVARGALHRFPVDAARDVKIDTGGSGLHTQYSLFHSTRILQAWDADIYGCLAVRRHDIGQHPPFDGAHINRDSALRVMQRVKLLDQKR